MNETQKILSAHLVSGEPATDKECAIKIGQALTQDSTGAMTYLRHQTQSR